jgi:hypothetical protein
MTNTQAIPAPRGQLIAVRSASFGGSRVLLAGHGSMLMSMPDPIAAEDLSAWLDDFADTFLDKSANLQDGFLDSKLFGPPVEAIYLRVIARDNFDNDPVGWVQFEATIRGGEVIKTDRVRRPR